jgi:hypothetical protein
MTLAHLQALQIPPSVARALDDLYASGPLQPTKPVSVHLRLLGNAERVMQPEPVRHKTRDDGLLSSSSS